MTVFIVFNHKCKRVVAVCASIEWANKMMDRLKHDNDNFDINNYEIQKEEVIG
jgi:hypothetical protein